MPVNCVILYLLINSAFWKKKKKKKRTTCTKSFHHYGGLGNGESLSHISQQTCKVEWALKTFRKLTNLTATA